MAVLTARQRRNLSPNQFALSGGRYPINDAAHARNALARASQQHNAGNLSDSDYAIVKRRASAALDAHGGHAAHADGVKDS